MSTDGLTLALEEVKRQTQEIPTAEYLRRLADQSPTFTMPRLYATQQFGQMQEDLRARVIDDHIINLRALGHDDLAKKWEETQADMGAINVTGDTYNIHPGAPQQPQVTQQPAATPAVTTTPTPASTPNKMLWPAIIGAAVLGTGAAGTTLYHMTQNHNPATTVSQPAKFEYKYGIAQRPTP